MPSPPVRLTPADVGRRVSVRARLRDDPRHTATDAVGVLRSWQDGVLAVERRDGSTARVPERDLLAGKVLPDQPPARRR